MNKKFILGALSILAFTTSLIFINFASAESFLTQNSGGQLEGGAAPLLVEDFTYPVGSLLTANGWSAHSGAGTNPITVTSPGLTFNGYPSSGVGNAVSLTTSGEDVNRPFAAQTTGMVYAAFMVNVSEAAVDAIGGYFFHLGPDPVSTTFRGRVFVKKDESNNIAFGISKTATAAPDVAFTPFSYSLNTTYVLVVKYTIVDGAANDTVALFVLTTIPASEPAPTITAPDTSAGDISPGTVSLRQGTASTSPTLRVDGIRVGTSWASVTQGGGATPTPSPRDANVDFNGDGKSDWVVTRSADLAVVSQITWFISYNGENNLIATPFGLSTDVRVPEDYDGDGKDDIAVWRNNSPDSTNRAYFFILQSMTNTVRIEQFGQTGDDPRVVADYDGDNKADLAVYRVNENGQNFFFYRSSLTSNNFTSVAFGAGSNVRPYVGDFDGDGKADFGVHVNGQFIILINGGNTVEYINWGAPLDFLVPGDFDGDGKSDFCVVRQIGNQWVWFILERDGGGTGANGIIWGLVPDTLAPGDYDGDGRQDVAVWRSNPDPAMNFFFVRRSSDSTLLTYEWGRQGDRAEAFWYVQVGGIVLRNGPQ